MTTISLACPKCGIIKKSGKASCCAHGGSWFKNCGGAGNTNVDHTWYEGIKACKARSQSEAAVGQQANAAQRKGNHSSDDGDLANPNAVITPETTFFTLMTVRKSTSTSVPALVTASAFKRANVSVSISTANSTPMPTSMIVPDHILASTPALYDNDTENARVITTTSARMSTPSPTVMVVNASVTTSIRKLMVHTSTDMIINAKSRSSDSTSITVQGFEKLSKITAHLSIVLIMIF